MNYNVNQYILPAESFNIEWVQVPVLDVGEDELNWGQFELVGAQKHQRNFESSLLFNSKFTPMVRSIVYHDNC